MNDIDGAPLQFLSTDEHGYLGGSTQVHGTLAIEGVGDLAAVTLEVVDASTGAVIDTPVVPAAGEQLLVPLGEAGRVAVTESQLLFEIPSAAFANFDRNQNGYVELRVRARTTDGREDIYSHRDLSTIWKLVRYTADNRYFVGEEEQGGNDWVTPDVKALVEQFQDVQFGDFSNMNGGNFPPHVSHQRGVDIDVWFPGYNNLDGDAARFILDLLNQPGVIERVDLVFIAYTQTNDDDFWSAIHDIVLADGRPATAVLVPEPDHSTHFHLRLLR